MNQNSNLITLKKLLETAIEHNCKGSSEHIVIRPRPTEKKVEITFSIWINTSKSVDFEPYILRIKSQTIEIDRQIANETE